MEQNRTGIALSQLNMLQARAKVVFYLYLPNTATKIFETKTTTIRILQYRTIRLGKYLIHCRKHTTTIPYFQLIYHIFILFYFNSFLIVSYCIMASDCRISSFEEDLRHYTSFIAQHNNKECALGITTCVWYNKS